ncbi:MULTISPECIES: GNAT family N-acetyltransferase [unclassified Streptomyces]|uniref:GNAT family N-acetyltransferase n=1 Tax=unclassified Streptomyces TaxID=2593676 RepID=UPI00278C46B4|nr:MULTISPECIES: GNAT family N-acetyltransferase [unclassified Streptomyces]
MIDSAALRIHERLALLPELRPVRLGEGRRFALWDLASTAEGALGEILEPDSLTVSLERRLRLRLGAYGRDRRIDDNHGRRYWITDGHGTVGTIAVGLWPTGGDALQVWSLYVHPVARHRGMATAVLDAVYAACVAEGLGGYRLDAYWTWRDSVRFYLGRGLWLTSWKRALALARLSFLPEYEVREAPGGDLEFWVAGDGPLLVAGRSQDGKWLRLTESEAYARVTAAQPRAVMPVYAHATLALHLAVRGRPLVREEEAEWVHRWSGDTGGPEGLAYRIGRFEQAARHDGWLVPGDGGD